MANVHGERLHAGDHTLATLISGVEQRVGKDKVLFVVTSTGYSDEARKNLDKYRVPTGTFYINRTANLLNVYLSAIYGQGRYVEQYYGNELYLNHKAHRAETYSNE